MSEPLLESEKQTFKYHTTPLDIDNPSNNKDFLKNVVDIKIDTFSSIAAENQMKRLITKEIPKYVGLYTLGVNLSSNGNLIPWFDLDFNSNYDAGYFNPHTKQDTILKVEHFWLNNKEIFLYAYK